MIHQDPGPMLGPPSLILGAEDLLLHLCHATVVSGNYDNLAEPNVTQFAIDSSVPPVPEHPPGQDSDAALLAAIASGDVDALRALHHRHAPWLRVRLARRCADRDLVDDALQDTFVSIWRSAKRYRRQGDTAAWIWTIAIRRLISALRSRRPPEVGFADDLGTTESAENLALIGIEHGDLGRALHRLAPELRAVIQATVLDGLTTKEAAILLGIPEGTVKTRAMRARARLREELT